MPNLPTPPRHLQHGAPSVPRGPLVGRHAARIRAIANSNQLPQERARADSMVLTAWLTSPQRARYATTLRSGSRAEDFVELLADERRVVLEEGADPVADELESAAEAERAARQTPLRVAETALLLVALGCLITVVVKGIASEETGVDAFAVQDWPLAASLVVAVILASVVGSFATRARDRRLLDWAVSRPGQLGRGLPLRRRLQSESAGPAILRVLAPALLVACAVIAICVGAAILLITLLRGDEDSLATMAVASLGGGVLSLLVAVLVVHLRGRRLEQIVRRARATEWFGQPEPPEQTATTGI